MKGRMVFLTQDCPEPARSGGALRDSMALYLLRGEGFEVRPIWYGGGNGLSPFRARSWRRALSPFRSYVQNGHDPRVVARLRELFVPGAWLWLSRLAMSKYLEDGRRLGYRVVLDEHNVESELLWGGVRGPLSWWRASLTSREEAWAARAADLVVVTSEDDGRRLEKLAPGARVRVVPNAIDTTRFLKERENPLANRPDFLFPGTFSYHPNLEGLQWVLAHVLPWLRDDVRAGRFRLRIAGSGISPALARTLAAERVEVTLDPEAMEPWLGRSRAVFVPLLSGSGTRLKILEALAAGCPVVSTRKGAEGLAVTAADGVFLADGPEEFAAAIRQVAAGDEVWRRASVAGWRRVSRDYSWAAQAPKLRAIFADTEARG